MVYGLEVAVYSEVNKKHKNSVGRTYNFCTLNLLVHHVNITL
jgi:hypothetical protein